MLNTSLALYHRLPASMQSLAATLQGFRLQRRRYGPESEEMVRGALDRDYWSNAQLRDWQSQRLEWLLERAATRVPYYRDYWRARGGSDDNAAWRVLENWPVLEKDTVRENPRAFLVEDRGAQGMYLEHTSGTTGKPLSLFLSRATVRAWYALFEARCRRWYGLTRTDRWANLGGQLVVPVERRRPPFWVWNAAMRQLYMSSYHLAPDLVPCYLDALDRYRVKYLFGYTSSLLSIAREALDRHRQPQDIRAVITNAEPLLAHERDIIGQAFGCPVRETYGMCELTAAASECPAGRLHLWPEVGVVEILDGTVPVAQGEAGDMVCTGLLNSDMPLVRYRVGDRGALDPAVGPCECGRLLPVLSRVEGRVDDVLVTPDGRRVGRLDPVFKAGFPIREAQIIQQSLDRVRVKLVPARDYDEAAGRAIAGELKLRLGEVRVDVELVDRIPREPNGKMRAVVSELAPRERRVHE